MPLDETHRSAFESALRDLFGRERVETAYEQRITYECDGHTLARRAPDAIIFPDTTDEVVEAVRICRRFDVPFLARGAGTGLSGGAVAAEGGLIIETARMNRILSIDVENRAAVVQPGLVNLKLSLATRLEGLFYAPDPSSQGACTLGGNVAENSGGPHTLKYGVTTNHVLALEMVLPDGERLRCGSMAGETHGYDLPGVITGSEGTFGIITEITVRLMPLAESVSTFLAVFDDLESASAAVSAVLVRGIVPAAMEIMDQLAVEAVESHLSVGFPTDAGAVLLIELEGSGDELTAQQPEIERACREQGACSMRKAADERERQALWRGRKLALGALGKIAKAYYTHDGVVPRSRLPEAVRTVRQIGERHRLRIANVCHAGDGNLHPLILYDPADSGEIERVRAAGADILSACTELGGALSGEHGIGMEKRDLIRLMFDDDDLDQMRRLREVFDPELRSNPGKVFPTGGRCGDLVPARAARIGGWL
ncbi:MAG: FAD-binding protein [Acidobacteriota bacterium]|nr:MAG: FAD-binding protein [Acidobacteriota bacterium]